jgi:hypothetical protein
MYLFCYIFKTPPVDLDFVSLQLFAHNVTQKLEERRKHNYYIEDIFLLIFNKKKN